MLKKQITSLLAIMMAFAVIIGFAPQMSGPVYAEDTENYGLVNGIPPKADGAVIWLGDTWMTDNNWNTNGSRERRWRIIGENESNWLLISDSLLCNNRVINNGAVTWQDAVDLCGTLYDHFSVVEQAAVPITEKNEPNGYTYQDSGHPSPDAYWDYGNQSVNANLFLLSAEEADTYFETNEKRTPGPWWLRSPEHSRNTGNVNPEYRGFIDSDGTFWYVNDTNTQKCSWARPAFQIDRSQVLFVSDAENGKSSATGADALAAFREASTNEWKLTLKDTERNFDVTKVTPSENGFTVTYTGAKTGENEYISAIVKDGNGDITKYGRIANVSAASGEVTITTAGKLAEGERLYVFNEQYNGDKKSDSASELKEIVTPQSIMVEVGPDHDSAAADLEEALDGYLTDGTFSALTEIYTEGSTIHIDFPLFVDNTNGEIEDLLTDAVWENMGTSYGEDYNRKEIGYQSSYESDDARSADLNEKNGLALENGQTFYLLWNKPVRNANVTVNDTPQCGFTVTGDSAASQTPKPDYVINGEGIDKEGSACYWWSTSSAEPGQGTYYAGTAKGGEEINVFVSLQTKYGYYFDPSQITCKLNGSPAKDMLGDVDSVVFTGTIPVEHVWADTQRVEKPATCTEAGEKSRYCTVCSDSDSAEIVPIPPLGHDWGAWMKVSDSEHQRVCATDGRHIEQKPHNWDKGVITKEPTATAEGEKTYTCIDCKAKKTEPVPVKEPGTDPDQKGTDGTAVGPGASAAAAEKAIVSMKTDTDPKGAVFSKLKLKSPKQTKTSISLKWTKVSKAEKYVIYGNKCGKTSKPVKLATVTGTAKTFSKIKSTKIKKGTYYKFIVVALDKDNNVVSTSKLIHVATKGGKVTNHKSVKVKKTVVNKAKKLKKGKTLKLAPTTVKQVKKLSVRKHVAIRYESTNSNVATVSKNGVVKGKKKGTAYVYAYAQSGVFKKIKVVVK